MGKFFKFLYLILCLAIPLFFTTMQVIYTSTSTDSIIILFLVLPSLLGIVSYFSFYTLLKEGLIKKIAIGITLLNILFNFIYSAIFSFKNQLSIRYYLLFIILVILILILSTIITLVAISLIKKEYPLTHRTNLKAYYIYKVFVELPWISYVISIMIFIFKRIIPLEPWSIMTTSFIYAATYLIIAIVTTKLFKTAIYKKVWKLPLIEKGSSRSEVEEELGVYLDGASYFETIRPYRVNGKEINKYKLFFDDNDLYLGYEKSTHQKWTEYR